MRVHATLVDLGGSGVLIVGPSGVGKSECALELVRRGHRLIADDAVQLRRTANGLLRGRAGAIVRGMIEIRGLGLLHLPDLFGPESVSEDSSVDLVCRLTPRSSAADRAADRVGEDRAQEDWLGVSLPRVEFVVPAVASIATLVETALRDLHARRHRASGAAVIDARLEAVKTERKADALVTAEQTP